MQCAGHLPASSICVAVCCSVLQCVAMSCSVLQYLRSALHVRGGGLGSRSNKMYGERLGNGVEYHLMSPTPRR